MFGKAVPEDLLFSDEVTANPTGQIANQTLILQLAILTSI